MSLFEVGSDGLIPFRQPVGGAATYEQVTEDVLWENFELVLGEPLLRVRRRPQIAGGRPALVALDSRGGVVVMHTRAVIDRADLTDCLEFAAWARGATGEQLASLYWRGEAEFWSDWRAFCAGDASLGGGRAPRLKLITAEFAGSTASTFAFLVDSGVPVQVVKATVYEDARGRLLFDVRPQEELAALNPRGDTSTPERAWARVPGAQVTVDLPAEAVSRARVAAAEPMYASQTPLQGELIPPADISAEQLRNDPLGVDQIVAGRVTAVEPGTPEPAGYASATGPREVITLTSGGPATPAPVSDAAPVPIGSLPDGGSVVRLDADPMPRLDGERVAADRERAAGFDSERVAGFDGEPVPRFEPPSETAAPRFEPQPAQPAAGLDAAPGQPFVVSGGPARSSGEQAHSLGQSAAVQSAAVPFAPRPTERRALRELPSGAYVAPARFDTSPTAFQPPAEPAPYRVENSSFPDAEPLPPSGTSFIPPVEPAPYAPPIFALPAEPAPYVVAEAPTFGAGAVPGDADGRSTSRPAQHPLASEQAAQFQPSSGFGSPPFGAPNAVEPVAPFDGPPPLPSSPPPAAPPPAAQLPSALDAPSRSGSGQATVSGPGEPHHLAAPYPPPVGQPAPAVASHTLGPTGTASFGRPHDTGGFGEPGPFGATGSENGEQRADLGSHFAERAPAGSAASSSDHRASAGQQPAPGTLGYTGSFGHQVSGMDESRGPVDRQDTDSGSQQGTAPIAPPDRSALGREESGFFVQASSGFSDQPSSAFGGQPAPILGEQPISGFGGQQASGLGGQSEPGVTGHGPFGATGSDSFGATGTGSFGATGSGSFAAGQVPYAAHPMPSSGPPAGHGMPSPPAEPGAAAFGEPPNNVIPLGGRQPSGAAEVPPRSQWETQVNAGSYGDFAGPEFRLPGLAAPQPPQQQPFAERSGGTSELPSFGAPNDHFGSSAHRPAAPTPVSPATTGGFEHTGPPPPGAPISPVGPATADMGIEPPLAPPPFRPGAHEVSGPPRLDFPSTGLPSTGLPSTGLPSTGLPPGEALPRRVPGGFGGGPLPSTGSSRGAHADRGPQFHGSEPGDADASDMARDGEPLDPRMLRVPDAPAWEPERANGYHSENGRTRH